MPSESPTPARRTVCMALCASLLPISACESKPMEVALEVVLFSYLDRPIFDVLVNGQDIGVSDAFPRTGGGSMQGPVFKVGPVKVSWRFADSGETVHAKNSPMLENVRREDQFLGVHVLPDDTVELTVTEHYPKRLARGIEMNEAWKNRHGK